MKQFAVGIVLLIALSSLNWLIDAQPDPLIIATWNIRFIPEDKLDYNAASITYLLVDKGIDILMLQEVSDGKSGTPLVEIIKSLEQVGEFAHCVSEEIGDSGRNLAFIYNKLRVVSAICNDIREVALIDQEMGKNRPALEFRFKTVGGFDGRIINLHLRHTNCSSPECSQEIRSSIVRQAQLDALQKELEPIVNSNNEDKDIIIAGDFNGESKENISNLLNNWFEILFAPTPTTVAGGNYDHFGLSHIPGAMEEWQRGPEAPDLFNDPQFCTRMNQMLPNAGFTCTKEVFKDKVSDHYPVLIYLEDIDND